MRPVVSSPSAPNCFKLPIVALRNLSDSAPLSAIDDKPLESTSVNPGAFSRTERSSSPCNAPDARACDNCIRAFRDSCADEPPKKDDLFSSSASLIACSPLPSVAPVAKTRAAKLAVLSKFDREFIAAIYEASNNCCGVALVVSYVASRY
ncbi:hypothetical protein SDC9_59046 [bioreactor metagenome]|uniref:Uncharacterized protein n=1 Tax=bioreactor metagenome TaxID=1076179 RepID=A0A644X954_9ZZZZ